MTSWRDEYLQNLRDRDERAKASYRQIDTEFIAAFTDLAEHIAALQAEKAVYASANVHDAPRKPTLSLASESIVQVKSDLAEALRSKGQLQARLRTAEAELGELKAKQTSEFQRIQTLLKERTYLGQKLKDKDEELRGKTKLLDDVHDETISLNLQLNVAERKVKSLEAEVKDLIDRWMARKGREAEEMNRTLQQGKDVA